MNYKLMIFFLLLAVFLITIFFFGQQAVSVLQSPQKMDSLVVRYGYDSLHTIVIKDSDELHKIDTSLMAMEKTTKFYGGYSDTTATFFLYKGNNATNFTVSHSPYYGWVLGAENGEKFEAPYMYMILRKLLSSK